MLETSRTRVYVQVAGVGEGPSPKPHRSVKVCTVGRGATEEGVMKVFTIVIDIGKEKLFVDMA